MSEISEYIESYSKYANIDEQLKDCKYDDISIRIDPFPLYNINNVHIIIEYKGTPWYCKFVTTSMSPFYIPLHEEELQTYIRSARRFFKYTESNLNIWNNKNEQESN